MRPRSAPGNQSPTSDAVTGPAAAVTAPRHSRATSSCPNDPAVALHSMAAPQVSSAKPSSQVRRTRSASTPNGSENTAPTTAVTVTSRPTSVLPMPSARRSSTAEAPTVAVSALASASTHASSTTARVRAGPPTAAVSWRRAAAPPRRSARAGGPNIAVTARAPAIRRNHLSRHPRRPAGLPGRPQSLVPAPRLAALRPEQADALPDGVHGLRGDPPRAGGPVGEHPVQPGLVGHQPARLLPDRGEGGDDDLGQVLLEPAVAGSVVARLQGGDRLPGQGRVDPQQVGHPRLGVGVGAHLGAGVGDRPGDLPADHVRLVEDVDDAVAGRR